LNFKNSFSVKKASTDMAIDKMPSSVVAIGMTQIIFSEIVTPLRMVI
jgi:hypothetical protein